MIGSDINTCYSVIEKRQKGGNMSTLSRQVKLAGILLLPLVTYGAQERSCWLRDAAVPANTVVYALCEQGGVWATADGGATWTKRDTGTNDRLRAMAFIDAQQGFVVGDHGLMA